MAGKKSKEVKHDLDNLAYVLSRHMGRRQGGLWEGLEQAGIQTQKPLPFLVSAQFRDESRAVVSRCCEKEGHGGADLPNTVCYDYGARCDL